MWRWTTWESLHASLYICEGELYLAVLYQYLWAGVAVGIYVLVGIVFIKGLRFWHLHFLQLRLLCIKKVQLVFGKVVNNSSTVGITDNVHRSSEPIPVFFGWDRQRHVPQDLKLNCLLKLQWSAGLFLWMALHYTQLYQEHSKVKSSWIYVAAMKHSHQVNVQHLFMVRN